MARVALSTKLTTFFPQSILGLLSALCVNIKRHEGHLKQVSDKSAVESNVSNNRKFFIPEEKVPSGVLT